MNITDVAFIIDACKVSFLNCYFLILKKVSLVGSMLRYIKFASAPSIGLYSHVASLNIHIITSKGFYQKTITIYKHKSANRGVNSQ